MLKSDLEVAPNIRQPQHHRSRSLTLDTGSQNSLIDDDVYVHRGKSLQNLIITKKPIKVIINVS